MEFIKIIIQMVIVIALAPLASGIIRKIKAKSQHRRGASIFQIYFDIYKLFKKDVIVPENSSWIFWATPYIYFVTLLIAALFVPAVPQLFHFSFFGDIVLFVYLLALGRFFMVLSGLDAGSTFGGMGSSREMMISALIEPSLIVVLFTLGLSSAAKAPDFKGIYTHSASVEMGIFSPMFLLLFAAMIIVLIAETARIPVDDPATHLELTMVHEAMILEYSGRYLALMQLSASVKQLLLITLIINIFLPFGISVNGGIVSFLISLVLYVAKVIIVAAVIGLIEINFVKLRLFSVPNHAALAFILAILGFMSSFVFGS